MADGRRALVTGGLGFIGSHLVEALLGRGEDATVMDNLSTNVVPPDFFGRRCEVRIGDVAQLAEMEAPFDRIYHLADIAGPARVLHHGGEIAHVCASNTRAVLQATQRWRARTLIVSSSEVYGRECAFREENDMIVPAVVTARLEYGVGKALSEIAALNAVRREGLDVNVVRPFNVAGPRQSSVGGFVIPRFFEAALAGEPLEVFDGGTQTRAFCHVIDTADSLIAVMNSRWSGEVFNSGNAGNRTSIGALARDVRDLAGSSSPIVQRNGTEVFGPLYAESFDKIPNTAKIETMTDWRPARALDRVLGDVHNAYGARAESL